MPSAGVTQPQHFSATPSPQLPQNALPGLWPGQYSSLYRGRNRSLGAGHSRLQFRDQPQATTEKTRFRGEGTTGCGCHTARTGLGCLLPNHPPASHPQQLQQGRGVPVTRGVEEQDAHLRPTARRGGDGGIAASPTFPAETILPPLARPRPSGPRTPPLPLRRALTSCGGGSAPGGTSAHRPARCCRCARHPGTR